MKNITRRSFLSPTQNPKLIRSEKLANKDAPKFGLRSAPSLNTYNGSWTSEHVKHLLRRTLFGATKSDIAYFSTKTMIQAVQEILSPSSTAIAPTPPLRNYTYSSTSGTDVSVGQTWVNTYISGDGTLETQRRNSYRAWWVGLMINQDRSILEKMVLFWHNHFATEVSTIGNGIYCYKHNKLLRDYALGNFKTFVKKISTDPAMLIYLNGKSNNKTAPDENYARELQELFTIGKEYGNTYTEDDVKAVAKVLTGFQIDNTTLDYKFTSSRHDTTDKQFSSYYGNAVITGKTGAAGETELDELITLIFTKTEVAKYLCRKLYRFFVYYHIDASIETNIIEPLADILRNNNYDIIPVLKKLFESEHFYDANTMGCIIKNPIDFVVATARQTNLIFPDNTNIAAQYGQWEKCRAQMQNMQMDPGEPPSVAGWQAYYQYPEYHEIWVNADTLLKRTDFLTQLLNNGFSSNGTKLKLDVLSLADTFPNPSDPNMLISDAVYYILGVDISTLKQAQLKTDILLSGQSADYYWTNDWNNYKANPTNTTVKNIVETRLKQLFDTLLKLEEFQLS